MKKLYAFFLAGSPWQRLGALLVLGVALFALLAPFIWPAYAEQDLSRFLEPSSLAEPLGRDQLGRSVIARLAHAAQRFPHNPPPLSAAPDLSGWPRRLPR